MPGSELTLNNPKPPTCRVLKTDFRKKTVELTLSIYQKNFVEYHSEAYACRVLHKSRKFWTGPIGGKYVEPVRISPVAISQAQCEQMRDHAKCAFVDEKLVGDDQFKNSKGEPEIDWPLPILNKFWTWYNHEWTECVIFKTTVSAHYGDTTILTPLGEAPHINYNKGFCSLADGTVLLWEPDRRQSKEFVFSRRWEGKARENGWIADFKTYALTISDYRPIWSDGEEYYVTDQGDVVLVSEWKDGQKRVNEGVLEYEGHNQSKVKRSVELGTPDDGTGIVLSPQEAARLQSLSFETAKAAAFIFEHTLASICSSQEIAYSQMNSIITADPTLAARPWLNVSHIQARMMTDTVLEIWPCAELDEGQYGYRKSGESCFEFIPITISVNNTVFEAFLDPITKIVSENSKTVPCEIARWLLVKKNGSFFELTRKMVL